MQAGRNLTLALALAIALATASMAAGAQPAAKPSSAASAPSAKALPYEGEVRKLDLPQGKVTLRHGPLTQLDMGAMTMVFKADPKLLAGLKVGDKVKFNADMPGGVLTVTALQPAR